MLKKNLFPSLFMILLFACPAFSQNVAINEDGSPPNPNAILDVKSSNKGLLIPRISTSARLVIPNTKGLLVYDTTTSTFWYNTGAGWQPITAGAGGWIDSVTSNVAWGYKTAIPNLQLSDTANTAIGSRSLTDLRHGMDNTAVGANTLSFAYKCNDNTAMGQLALFYDTTGSYNTAIGAGTLFQTTAGNYNTALGEFALWSNSIGSGNTALGSGANVSSGTLTNATAIGYNAVVNASNKVRIGNGAVTVIEGQVPFTTPSDGRFKFDVQEDVKGLDFIRQLRPVTYHFDVERFEKASATTQFTPILQAACKEASLIRRSGFIAQEVERAAKVSGYDFSGIIHPKTAQEHYSLSYESFVVPLVKAVQEQQQEIERLEKRLAEMERRLDAITLRGATKP